MREQPSKLKASELEAICDYVHELGHLKSVERAGWKLAGITDVESVAEHSFRTAIIAMLLATVEGADPARTALMCLFHDLPETRIGDIPSVGKKYLAIRNDVDVAGDQVRGLPAPLASMIHEISLDYRIRESHEARLAKDADRLECLAQALEYVAAGHAAPNRGSQAPLRRSKLRRRAHSDKPSASTTRRRGGGDSSSGTEDTVQTLRTSNWAVGALGALLPVGR